MFADTSALLWVVDAKAGKIHRFDVQGKPVDHWMLEPGLGPVKLTPDAKYALVVNPSQHLIHVVDVATAKEKHRITLSGQPYDILFSAQYGYIRTLHNEQIGLLSLSSLDGEQPILKLVPAGAGGLAAMQDLPRASSMALTLDRAGAFFTTPSERTLYYYMEGMNSPSSGLKTYGHTPLAAMVVQRGLREISPGRYSAVIRLPASKRMVVALASETPVVRECLGLTVDMPINPQPEAAMSVQWLNDSVQTIRGNAAADFRVRVKDQHEGVETPVRHVQLRIVPAHGGVATVWTMQADPDKRDEWFASGQLPHKGGYYVHIEADQPLASSFVTVMVEQ